MTEERWKELLATLFSLREEIWQELIQDHAEIKGGVPGISDLQMAAVLAGIDFGLAANGMGHSIVALKAAEILEQYGLINQTHPTRGRPLTPLRPADVTRQRHPYRPSLHREYPDDSERPHKPGEERV